MQTQMKEDLMNPYDFFMRPLEAQSLSEMRKNLMNQASGSILELGVGTGANIPYYHQEMIISLVLSDFEEPEKIKKHTAEKVRKHVTIEDIAYKKVDAQNIPFKDESFDTVISTLIFCSVSDVKKGLEEIKRVLKPNGKFLFIEHVISPNPSLASIMNGVSPLWEKVAHGCHLNRDFEKSLTENHFHITGKYYRGKNIFFGGLAQPLK